MVKKIIFVFLITAIFLYNLSIYYIDKSILQTQGDAIYNSCHKIWSSRGVYTTKGEQNSLLSIQRAFDDGYAGVEIDFYYDVKRDKFILSHSKPKKDENGVFQYSLKDGKLLTLEEVFSKLGENHYFWLDYKNLDRISYSETDKAIKRLDKISEIHSLKDRIYIEGSTPIKLSKYTKSGYKTILAFQPLKEKNIFSSISSNIYKLLYYSFDISGVAMPYGSIDNPKYGKTTQENFKSIPTFLFHVPTDIKLLKELNTMQDVRVILAGRDKSVRLADVNMCQDKVKSDKIRE